jgi:hypothetical protein
LDRRRQIAAATSVAKRSLLSLGVKIMLIVIQVPSVLSSQASRDKLPFEKALGRMSLLTELGDY